MDGKELGAWLAAALALSCGSSDKSSQSPSESPTPTDTPTQELPPTVVSSSNSLNLPNDSATATEADNTGWKFLTTAQGLPSRVFGASLDSGGNLWVAGGAEGIFVRKAGEGYFRHFGAPYPAISIAGGEAGVAYVGYQGLDGCDMAWDSGGPPSVYKSGDADRVVLSGDGLSRAHYDISSGPGVVSAEPRGREKLCTIYRIVYDATTRSVWFGANHGVAWGDPNSTRVVEHTHPAINGYQPNAITGELHYTLLSGDYWGLATDAAGNLWLGGRERSAFFQAGPDGLNFWGANQEIQKAKLDVWPDQVPQDPRPDQEVLDNTYGFAPLQSGLIWIGSLNRGLAVLNPAHQTVAFYKAALRSPQVTALRADPQDDSVWAGHAGQGGVGGLTRLKDNQWIHYGTKALGRFAQSRVYDIQVTPAQGGQPRRVLVAFYLGGVGIYTGD